MATAILVDGDFFLRRYRQLKGKASPKIVAKDLHRMCLLHLTQNEHQQQRGIKTASHSRHVNRWQRDLYRIFFYDCPPLSKKVHNPITKKAIDFSKTQTAVWRLAFHSELKKLRKVALRLGYLNDRCGHWRIRPERLKSFFPKALPSVI
jgi:hypothetical protein